MLSKDAKLQITGTRENGKRHGTANKKSALTNQFINGTKVAAKDISLPFPSGQR